MSSILTNSSAMVALQTLKGINSNLAKTQDEISTGKSVATAKDNAAVWAISKVMESDVSGFTAISDSLSLADSAVSTARGAAETVTKLLDQMKTKIISAQEATSDRSKIQTDITVLKEQIESVVGGAQLNGLNLLSNLSKTAGSGNVNVLASLDRSTGGVKATDIKVGKNDLTTTAGGFTGGTYAAGTASTLNATQTATLTVTAPTAAGQVYSFGMTGTDANSSTFDPAKYTTAATTAGAALVSYISRDGDTAADVAKGLAQAFAIYSAKNGMSSDVLKLDASGGSLVASSTKTDGTDTIAVRVDAVTTPTTVTIGGGLAEIAKIDVTTDSGADAALAAVEYMMQTAISAAADFGSSQGRLATQKDFVSSLTDSLKNGISTLVDADMEEASARLQALQVQQQLGVQSLSIANQAPQTILSLFRG